MAAGIIVLVLFVLMLIGSLLGRWYKTEDKNKCFIKILWGVTIILAITLVVYGILVDKVNGCGQIFFLLSLFLLEGSIVKFLSKDKHKAWKTAACILFAVLFFHISTVITIKTNESLINDKIEIEINDKDNYQLEIQKDSMNFLESASYVISSTFQTFSLDFDYSDFISNSEAYGMAKDLRSILGILLTFLAPVVGGCILLSIIVDVAPHLKLLIYSGYPFKQTRYIFSELNDHTIETAESIIKKRKSKAREIKNNNSKEGKAEFSWLKHFMIIFTDTYTDKEMEHSQELRDRAKAIGAICVKDDITELKMHLINPRLFLFKRKYVYFFMDLNEENNAKDSLEMLSLEKEESKHFNKFKNANIEFYIFTQNKEIPELVENAYKNIKDIIKSNKIKTYEKVIKKYIGKEAMDYSFSGQANWKVINKILKNDKKGIMTFADFLKANPQYKELTDNDKALKDYKKVLNNFLCKKYKYYSLIIDKEQLTYSEFLEENSLYRLSTKSAVFSFV